MEDTPSFLQSVSLKASHNFLCSILQGVRLSPGQPCDRQGADPDILSSKSSLRYIAKALNRLCLARNVATDAGNFEALETMVSDAAQLLKKHQIIRQREPAASLVVARWFHGGRDFVLKVRSIEVDAVPSSCCPSRASKFNSNVYRAKVVFVRCHRDFRLD